MKTKRTTAETYAAFAAWRADFDKKKAAETKQTVSRINRLYFGGSK